MSDYLSAVWDHVDELRGRLIYVLIFLVLSSALGFFYAPQILEQLMVPLKRYSELDRLVFITPQEAFFTFLKLAVVTGVLLTLPFFVYQVSAFVWPALEPGEKRLYLAAVPAIFVLFAAGVFFAYAVLLPFVFRFFLGFATAELQPFLTLGHYVGFVIGLTVPFGLVFQLPVLILILAKLGIVSPDILRQNRRYALLAIAVLAAFLTPPDFVSQVAMILPLIALFELSLLVARWGHREDDTE